MIKKIAWNTFKNTGNIDTFLEYKQIENIETKMQEQNGESKNGEYKNQWNSSI